jgi:sulfatase maturation enzyme AslB (radical SAM superfamily)
VFKGTEFEKSYFKCDIRTEWFRDTKFYDELLTQCDELEEVWINGGEPTLIKEHGYFLEKLIENGKSKDINLHYSLNMTDVPDRFIEIWKKFKNVRIHLSIDDLDERNDYIRYGSKWNNIMDNFKKIIEYKDVFRIEVCQTVSAYNVFNIDNFKKMCLDYDVIVAHNYVNHPGFQHVSIIPSEMKDEILSNIKYLRDDEKNRLITELTKESNPEDLDKFIKFTYILDNKRGVKITDVLHEWKKYFNYE